MSGFRRGCYCLIGLLILLGLAYFAHNTISAKQKKAVGALFSPNFSVQVTYEKPDSWSQLLPSTGELRASQQVVVSASTSGHVVAKVFHDGQPVPDQATLIILEHETQQHQLMSTEAQYQLAKISWQRQKRLYQAHATAKADLDAAYQQMQSAEANWDEAKTQYRYTFVKAPFAGQVGVTTINVGDYLTQTSPIVLLQNSDILYLDVTVPEAEVPYIRLHAEALFTVSAYPNQIFHGEIAALQGALDSDTRMMVVRIIVDNDKHQLTPGMFATVQLTSTHRLNGFNLMDTAVGQSVTGDTVYLIKDGKVHLQPVTVLARRKGEVLISDDFGHTPIVSIGQTRVFEGAPAVIAKDPPIAATEDKKQSTLTTAS